MRTLSLALFVVGLSSTLAAAQGNPLQPSPSPTQPPNPSPMHSPAPLARPIQFMSGPPMSQIPGCMWASKIYSNGTTFCVMNGTSLTCKDDKWETQDANHCSGAPFLKPD